MIKLYHVGSGVKKGVYEGGAARNIVLYKYFKKNKYKLIRITKNRILNICKIFSALFFLKNSKIVLQYPFLGVPAKVKFIRDIYLLLLKRASMRNKIFFDISDLSYEQAIDLELKIRKYFLEIEKVIFNINAKFSFASYAMRDYICKKYEVSIENTIVCENGGNRLNNQINISKYVKFIKKDKINIVYAGTLNKGRQIENILKIVLNNKKLNLILMGTLGKWINKEIQKSNIIYLGALEEELAHKIVSFCDIGLIPYDQDRFYYNIAFPTKLSFYITAGITFLSTEVVEVLRINKKYNFGYTEKIEKWNKFFNKINKDELDIKKKKINKFKKNFYWENIFKKINF